MLRKRQANLHGDPDRGNLPRLRLRRQPRRDGVWRPLDLPRRPLDALGAGSPLAHRLAHAAVASGLRGRDFYWRWAERVAGPPREAQLLLSSGLAVGLDCSDIAERRVYEGGYHPAERLLVAALVTKGGTVLDVGANIGLFAAACAELVGERGYVYAFEPNPPTFDRLRDTVGAMRQVVLNQVALSNEPGTAGLLLEPGHHGATALRAAGAHDSTVIVSTVDEIVKREGIGSIDLLKVDVEGEEERVLQGAAELFRSRRVAHALVEVHPARRPPAWLTSWLDAIADDFRAFRVSYEPGLLRFRRVPRLAENAMTPGGGSAFNLLVSRRDRLSEVSRTLAWRGRAN